MKKIEEPPLEEIFAALADRTRLRLLNMMVEGEICVCYFTAILGAPQPTISRHLAYLRRLGLVANRRDGKWVHYRGVSPRESRGGRVLRSVLAELRDDPELRADLEALQRACCATRLPRELADAPRPSLELRSELGRPH